MISTTPPFEPSTEASSSAPTVYVYTSLAAAQTIADGEPRPDTPTPEPTTETGGSSTRIIALDLLRGFIMVVMSLDHARAFISNAPLEHESWNSNPNFHGSVSLFITRFVTHLSAPGFFFLMGIGIHLFCESRLTGREIWPVRKVVRHFVIRGGLLVALAVTLFNKNDVSSGIYLSLGVLYALGINIVFGAFASMAITHLDEALSSYLNDRERSVAGSLESQPLLSPPRASGVELAETKAKTVCTVILFIVAVMGLIGFQFAVPNRKRNEQLISWIELLIYVPASNRGLRVEYPFAPWLPLTLLGIVYARVLGRTSGRKTALFNWAISVICLLIFIMVRANVFPNGFGNINNVIPKEPNHPVLSLLNRTFHLTKYPPSLAFVSLTMSINLMILGLFYLVPIRTAPMTGYEGRDSPLPMKVLELFVVKPLLAFGKSSLFFYCLHSLIYKSIGTTISVVQRHREGNCELCEEKLSTVALRSVSDGEYLKDGIGHYGLGLFGVYSIWIGVLVVVLLPACRWYSAFKTQTPRDSVWRFF